MAFDFSVPVDGQIEVKVAGFTYTVPAWRVTSVYGALIDAWNKENVPIDVVLSKIEELGAKRITP
jgi:hypothetical protein